MSFGLVLIPLISAFLGWFVIWMAIRMLFHPYKPKRVLGFTLQGIFPRKQAQIAEKLGKLVSNELFSFAAIEQKVADPAGLEKIMPHIEQHIDQFLRVKLPEQMPVISMFIGDKTINELKKVFTDELKTLFPAIMKSYIGNLQQDLDLEAMVIDKINGLSSVKLGEMLYSGLARELRLLGIMGGITGFIIGLIQAFITLL